MTPRAAQAVDCMTAIHAMQRILEADASYTSPVGFMLDQGERDKVIVAASALMRLYHAIEGSDFAQRSSAELAPDTSHESHSSPAPDPETQETVGQESCDNPQQQAHPPHHSLSWEEGCPQTPDSLACFGPLQAYSAHLPQ